MLRLHEIQQAFAEGVIEGKYDAVAEAIVPGGSALRNVALYRRLIRNNFVQVLRITYPALHRLVGDSHFGVLARGYMKRYPSTSGDLFPYGRHLPAFLQVLQAPRLLVELAQLEWACHEVHQAADAPPLSQNHLEAMTSLDPSRVTIRLHAAVRLLRFSLPVHRIWLALKSEALNKDAVDLPLPEKQTGVVVTRSDGKVQVTPLAWLDYRLVEALSPGTDVASIERMVLESEPEFDFARFMTTLMGLHVIAGCSVDEDL